MKISGIFLDSNRSRQNQYFNQLWVEQTLLYIKPGTYELFKNKVWIEDYLVDITSLRHRVTYTKFRLSDHSLVREVGRGKGPKIPEMSVCYAQKRLKMHFLIKCASKTTERNLIFSEISRTVPSFSSLDPISKSIYLMSLEDKVINKLLIEQIYRWSTLHHRTNI